MQKRFDVLDSFRGIAAVFIIVHHLNYTGSITEWAFFVEAELFVEMFFVLSGFVLTHSYAFRNDLNFRDFFISRTLRILPLHLFMLMVFASYGLLKYIAYQYGVLSHDIAFSGENTLSNLPVHALLLQAWIPGTGKIAFNAPAWSISVEYYMYMIFFVTLLFTKEKRNVVWVFLFIGTAILLFNGVDLGYLVHAISGISSFFLGALVYLLYKIYANKFDKISKYYYSILEVLLLVVIVYVVSSDLEDKVTLIHFVFALQMFVFAFQKGFISTVLKKNVFLTIGKLSYSIYLIHFFILFAIMIMMMIVEKFGFPMSAIIHKNALYGNIMILCTILIVLYISKYTYKYIELKGQNLKNRLK